MFRRVVYLSSGSQLSAQVAIPSVRVSVFRRLTEELAGALMQIIVQVAIPSVRVSVFRREDCLARVSWDGERYKSQSPRFGSRCFV